MAETANDNADPDQAVVEEVQRLIDELAQKAQNRLYGEKDDVRFTLTLPREFALLAAWLMFKADMERAGKPGPLPRPVALYLDDGRQARDWQRAKEYLQKAVGEDLNAQWRKLRDLTLPLLCPEDRSGTIPIEDVMPPASNHLDTTMSKRTLTATIEVGDDEAVALRQTANFYGLSVGQFLQKALREGIDRFEGDRAPVQTWPPKLDDDIPF